MTVQEAIEGLKYMISDNCTDTQSDFIDEIELAISALEKQIPKKPVKKERGRIQCVNGHNQPVQHYKYCPFCGQLIDWSDTE